MTDVEVLRPDRGVWEHERSPYVFATAGLHVDTEERRDESMRAWTPGLV